MVASQFGHCLMAAVKNCLILAAEMQITDGVAAC